MIQALDYIVFLKKTVLLFTVPTGPPHTHTHKWDGTVS